MAIAEIYSDQFENDPHDTAVALDSVAAVRYHPWVLRVEMEIKAELADISDLWAAPLARSF